MSTRGLKGSVAAAVGMMAMVALIWTMGGRKESSESTSGARIAPDVDSAREDMARLRAQDKDLDKTSKSTTETHPEAVMDQLLKKSKRYALEPAAVKVVAIQEIWNEIYGLASKVRAERFGAIVIDLCEVAREFLRGDDMRKMFAEMASCRLLAMQIADSALELGLKYPIEQRYKLSRFASGLKRDYVPRLVQEKDWDNKRIELAERVLSCMRDIWDLEASLKPKDDEMIVRNPIGAFGGRVPDRGEDPERWSAYQDMLKNNEINREKSSKHLVFRDLKMECACTAPNYLVDLFHDEPKLLDNLIKQCPKPVAEAVRKYMGSSGTD